MAPEPLPELIAFIAEFVSPLMMNNGGTTMVGVTWQPGGPWVSGA